MSKSNLDQFTWKQHGIGFGVFIYVLNVFVIPYFSDKAISLSSILFMIPICAVAGYGFGRYMKWKLEKE